MTPISETLPLLQPALLVALLGLAFGALLAIAFRFLAVREDPRIAAVAERLPGANCGGCGYAGCADCAKAIVLDGAAPSLCSAASDDAIHAIASLLGRAATSRERLVALVHCAGDESVATRRARYNGISDCASAASVAGGDKACSYGCLGYGTCARLCPVRAIDIRQGVAVVDPKRCIACGRCVAACPRKLIRLVPAAETLRVLCSSPEKGAAVRKVCQRGCIGCTLCAKFAPQAFRMEGNLAVREYGAQPPGEGVAAKCPAKAIVCR
ncbi:MAG: (Fe-S)-binding protein [Kiritimatiellia bacterium]|nr:(Fe-S)-binding protein [Kiritimatiellia bacterium]